MGPAEVSLQADFSGGYLNTELNNLCLIDICERSSSNASSQLSCRFIRFAEFVRKCLLL